MELGEKLNTIYNIAYERNKLDFLEHFNFEIFSELLEQEADLERNYCIIYKNDLVSKCEYKEYYYRHLRQWCIDNTISITLHEDAIEFSW